MVEHGLYIIKSEMFDLISSLGGECDMRKGSSRPTYCCLKDNKIEGLYWAIPTSDISHRSPEQITKYKKFISLPKSDLRSCYYVIWKTTKPAIYKISSCFPVLESYVERPFTSYGQPVVMKRREKIMEIETKLKRILAFEANRPDYFPQKITTLKNHLLSIR